MRFVVFLSLLLAAASQLATPAAPAVAADGSGAAASPWRRIDALCFFVADRVDRSSHVFRQGGLFLVCPSAGERAYALSVTDSRVYALDRAAACGDGAPAVTADEIVAGESLGTFDKTNRGQWLVWEDGGRSLAVKPKPPLIGKATLDEVLAEKPDYQKKAAAYDPDPRTLKALDEKLRGAEIVVGFGTWCPTCADWLPTFIKTVESLESVESPASAEPVDSTASTPVAPVALTFVAVQADYQQPAELLARYGIDSVPVFIVRKEGHELGRVTAQELDANPDAPIEVRLLRILQGEHSRSD